MAQLFDIKTLLLTTALINLVIAGLLGFYWKRQQTYPGFGFWAASHGIGCSAYILFALRGVIPDFLSIVAANFLLVLFSTLRLEGIRLFVDGTWRRSTLFLYPLLIVPPIFYFSRFADDILIRTIINNLFLATIVWQMLAILVRKVRQPDNGIYWAPIFFFSCFIGILLLRLGIWLLTPELRGMFASSAANNFFFLVVLLHDIGIAVSYLMLNAKRQTDELRVAHGELQTLTDSLHQQVRIETEKRLEQERIAAHKARLAALGEMLGVIAHQWRQPLAALAMTVQRLPVQQQQQRLTAAELEATCSEAMQQITHMSETIDEFRLFYSPDRIREVFSPQTKLQEALTLVEARLRVNDIELQQQCAAELPDLYGFPNQFKQALLNLLNNACDAICTRRQSSQDAVGGHIVIQLAAEGNGIRLAVHDNGCGVPPELADKLFEPFSTSKLEQGGTGLGLFLARTIVEDSFGGQLRMSSQPGATTFTLTIPGRKVPAA